MLSLGPNRVVVVFFSSDFAVASSAGGSAERCSSELEHCSVVQQSRCFAFKHCVSKVICRVNGVFDFLVVSGFFGVSRVLIRCMLVTSSRKTQSWIVTGLIQVFE